jgi:hypothetical protein
VALLLVSFVAFCGWSGSWPGRAKISFRVFRLLRGYPPGSVAWASIAAGRESVPEIFELRNGRWPNQTVQRIPTPLRLVGIADVFRQVS